MSDGEVGIGLSLLLDLADGMSSDEGNWSRSSRCSVQTPGVVTNTNEQERPESPQSTEGDVTFTHIDMYDDNGMPLTPYGLSSSAEPTSPPAPKGSPVQSLRSPPSPSSSLLFGTCHTPIFRSRVSSSLSCVLLFMGWCHRDLRSLSLFPWLARSPACHKLPLVVCLCDVYAPPVPDSRSSVNSRSSIDSHARPRGSTRLRRMGRRLWKC